jgi:anti-sigma B factor antagonist
MAQEDVGRLRPVGELDVATAPQLSALVNSAFASGARSLELDLSGVTFCDSAGLRVLADAAGQARRAGGTVIVRGSSPMVRRTLHLVGLHSLVQIADDGQGPA